MSNTLTMQKSTVFKTVKTRTMATLVAIVAAVALPQILHTIGGGASLGQTLLPMHLPVLLVGLLAGPLAGLVTGALSPLISFALSGMPNGVLLPFMMVELVGYGLVAGLLSTTKLPTFGKVLVAQGAGRLVRVVAILIAFYVLGNQAVTVASVWSAVVVGLPGLVLQWALLPLVMLWIEKRETNHE